ncbi:MULTISPECIES: hypothetical protein [unclassified Pseudofrankia]|uniref:hypothetical protein n=1 Tax=unclassified Pseudofrankia TaxID=2994372 RepID=UPI0008DA13B1|nr:MULTISPECIES: hypothetical protein [unclassified Pseudofrankia]MDT3441286.1 hypothetical protein [Pseudofrankia sp. BMG5.37]OHV48159.1 hypothetical protein BCD48_16270 [Pseudofrankia sp. BMG5.36]
MNQVLAGPALAADEISGGMAGLLIVVFLCVAAGFVFYFMFGSLKRLRRNVDQGQFGAVGTAGDPSEDGTPESKAKAVAVPRQADGSADADRNA